MPITLGSNIASFKAQRTLSISTEALARTFERLSSGQRINRASDDAAGLAIADNLKAQQRVATVAIRNANDGISTIAIADSALGEIGNVLSRLAELAEQSANGVFSTTQRSALANEFIALGSEIERIATTTQFNGVTLLSGGSTLTLQVGFNSGSTSQISFTGVQGTLAALGLASSGTSSLSYSIQAAGVDLAQSASRFALDAINSAISSLASTRGTLGATESRLVVAINNLTVARENFAAAESRIRDVDVATEAAELTRLNILQQAGSAVLAQANQQPSLALSLLR
ncbi:MAG: flagellin FliC [Oligoflexia bacterium]|nr:flagellin FliC [Oligoflexia bacterium]MBX7143823.1 flagellin FliC [Oligoflexia bacterium]